MKVLFSLDTAIITELKRRVTVRKRSELIEQLLSDYFHHEDEKKGWNSFRSLKKSYNKKTDPIHLGSVQWLSQDRRSH